MSASKVAVHYHSSENMREIADDSVQLVITNMSDNMSLTKVSQEIYRVLRHEGAFLFNVGQFPKGSGIYEGMVKTGRERFLPLAPYMMAGQVLDAAPFTLEEDMIMLKEWGIVPRKALINYEHWFLFTKSPLWGPVGGSWPWAGFEVEGVPQDTSIFSEIVVQWFLDLLTRPGDLVVDPYAGSGIVGKVAMKMDRRAVLYEIDPKREPQISANLALKKVPQIVA